MQQKDTCEYFTPYVVKLETRYPNRKGDVVKLETRYPNRKGRRH